jgi:hypothetical protein
MTINIPKTTHPLVKVIGEAGAWRVQMLMDNSHRKCELLVPDTIDESEVTVEVQFCNGRGTPIETGTIIQKGRPKKASPPIIPSQPAKKRIVESKGLVKAKSGEELPKDNNKKEAITASDSDRQSATTTTQSRYGYSPSHK